MDSRPALVLLADDQEWMSRSVESVLQPAGYAVLRAFTGRQCIALAASARPDAIIVNLHLPDMDGIDVLQALRDGPGGNETPRLAVSWDAPARRDRLRALDAGAWAVYSQPLDVDLVLSQLRTFIRVRQSHEALIDTGLLDRESGLYNARGLARRAREVGAEAHRRREPLACVMFAPEVAGLDEAIVEEVLDRTVAQLVEIVRRSGRISDVIGRLSRTEFAAVLPGTEAVGAMRLIERLQDALQGTGGGSARPTRLRAGYASAQDAADASDPIELLLRAASAMRQGAPDASATLPLNRSLH